MSDLTITKLSPIGEKIEEIIKKVNEHLPNGGEDPIVGCKLFHVAGAGTWWLYEHIGDKDSDIFMCFAELGMPEFAELGTVALRDMESLNVEIDKYFKPTKLSKVIADYRKSAGLTK